MEDAQEKMYIGYIQEMKGTCYKTCKVSNSVWTLSMVPLEMRWDY